LIQLGVIEVWDSGGREWLAKDSHDGFSFRLADDLQSLDVLPILEWTAFDN
jgi:hypothetical protein